MDNKTKPLKVYIATNVNNARSEEYYTTKEEVENNLQSGEKSTTTELHITKTNQHPRSKDLPITCHKMANNTM
jgi:hypothetical protein